MSATDPSALPTFDVPAALPINGLAAAYQPRRSVAAAVSIGWNLLLALSSLIGGAAWRVYLHIESFAQHHHLNGRAFVVGIYVCVYFASYAILNYPVELYFGYLEERQFGLAKDGIRAWTRDWIAGNIHHGLSFCFGAAVLIALQHTSPSGWAAWASLTLLVLFLGATFFAPALVPRELFDFKPVDDKTRERLESLIGPNAARELPPVVEYGARHLRDFTGGLVGMGRRQVLIVSRSTLNAASDRLLRFVLLHDIGHRRHHHLLLSALAGWAWVVLGLCVSQIVILRCAPATLGLPPVVAWLAFCLSAWMAAGEPLLAYLGRRLEYQADRFYLRRGGTVSEMAGALEELSGRNLAQTEGLRRRQTIFHPLPSIWNRIYAARRFAERVENG